MCLEGQKGYGGTCNCSEAIGWTEGEWKTPWCHEGACYTGQDYDECENKDNDHQLGDGTWCYDESRNTRCPTYSGNAKFESFLFSITV